MKLVVSRRGRRTDALILAAVVLTIASIPLVIAHFSQPSRNNLGGTGGCGTCTQYVQRFYDLHSLKGNSSIVVWANVTAGVQTDQGMVLQVGVLSYVVGTGPQTIFVGDIGLPGDPVLSVGQQYVLFLWHCGQVCSVVPEPSYAIPGGPQGKFLLQNGLVYGMKTLYPQEDSWLRIDANGVPLDQFTLAVQDETSSGSSWWYSVSLWSFPIAAATAVFAGVWLWKRYRNTPLSSRTHGTTPALS